MPKKPPRNAFYFFMKDFRDDQRAEGVTFRNMADVAEAASPVWRDLPAPARRKYEELAKMNKNDGVKYTSIGISVAEFEQRKTDEAYFDKNEHRETAKIVKTALSNEITHADFFIMDVNVGCRTVDDFIICEMTFIRFNIIDGLLDCYHEIINPGSIPMGYASDIKASCLEMGLDQPDEFKPVTNYKSMLANIIALMQSSRSSEKGLPPIFTMPDKVEAVEHFIIHMCKLAQEDVSPFRVYRLHRLFYYLVNGIASTMALGIDKHFPEEMTALTVLLKDKFQYYPGIACQHHEEIDKAGQCTTSRAKGWVFMMLERVCPTLGVHMRAVRHMPPDVEQESIITEFAAPVKNKMQPFPKKEEDDDFVGVKIPVIAKEKGLIVRQPKINYVLEANRSLFQQNSRPHSSTSTLAEAVRPGSQLSSLATSSVNSKGVLGSVASSGSRRLSGLGRGKDLAQLLHNVSL